MTGVGGFVVGQRVAYRTPGSSVYDGSKYSRIASMTAARIYVEGYDKPLHPGRVSALDYRTVATLDWIDRKPATRAIVATAGYRQIEPSTIDLRAIKFDAKTLTAIRDDATALLAWLESREARP